MSRMIGRRRTWALAAACVLAWGACGDADQAQDGGAAAAGDAGQSAVEPFDREDYGVFAQSDSTRGDGGTVGEGAEDAGGRSAEAGGLERRAGEAGAGPAEAGGSGRGGVLGTPEGANGGQERRADVGGEAGEGAAGLQGEEEATPLGLQDADSQTAPREATVAAGTTVRVALDEEVSAEKHLPGHAVIATVVADVTGPGGELLIGEGAKLLGRVVASEPSPGPGEDAHLEVAFETLSASGFERPVQAVLAGGARLSNPFGGFVEARPYQGRIRAGTAILVEIQAAFSVPRQTAAPPPPPPPGAGAGHAG